MEVWYGTHNEKTMVQGSDGYTFSANVMPSKRAQDNYTKRYCVYLKYTYLCVDACLTVLLLYWADVVSGCDRSVPVSSVVSFSSPSASDPGA
mgnify:CR=1 FL=1